MGFMFSNFVICENNEIQIQWNYFSCTILVFNNVIKQLVPLVWHYVICLLHYTLVLCISTPCSYLTLLYEGAIMSATSSWITQQYGLSLSPNFRLIQYRVVLVCDYSPHWSTAFNHYHLLLLYVAMIWYYPLGPMMMVLPLCIKLLPRAIFNVLRLSLKMEPKYMWRIIEVILH